MSKIGIILDEEYSDKLQKLAGYQNCSVHKVVTDAIDIMYCVLDEEVEEVNGN